MSGGQIALMGVALAQLLRLYFELKKRKQQRMMWERERDLHWKDLGYGREPPPPHKNR